MNIISFLGSISTLCMKMRVATFRISVFNSSGAFIGCVLRFLSRVFVDVVNLRFPIGS